MARQAALTLVAASALTSLAPFAARPADPVIPAPQAEFQSAFTDYKPFREQKMLPWKETLDELANASAAGGHAGHGAKVGMAGMDHKGGKSDMPAMAGMDHMRGKADMRGMDHKSGKADMPGMAGMDHKSAKAAAPSMLGMQGSGKEGMASHGARAGDRGAKGKPGEAAGKASTHDGHGALAMARTQTSPPAAKQMEMPAGPVSGTGVIWGIDKSNGKVKMTHEPIEALGWPRMTMIFRLKDGSLASQVKEGEKVDFSLEKSSSGYVISGFQKPTVATSR